MARTIKDALLDTRTARNRLKPRPKPYFRSLESGLHLGYRKPLTGSGKWVCRHYIGDQNYEVETIAVADDFSDPDGVAILDYRQAQAKARARMVARAHAAVGKTGPLTVAQVMADYHEFLTVSRKSGETAGYSIRAFILPSLGAIEVEALTTDRLRRWHHDLAKTGARVRIKGDAKQKFRTGPGKVDDGDDWKRRRRSTANRVLRILRGGLSRAFREGRISSDVAWKRLEPFRNVEVARNRFLSIPECKRLINASQPDFRALVQGALQTGARYGELCRLKVSDFTGTIAIRESKSGKPRHVILTDEGKAFFTKLCIGRDGADWMFKKADGTPWARSHQAVRMAEANKRAGISPPINFHGLRHTWASHAVMGGVPLMVVAKNLGHASIKMIEANYGHLAAGFVADEIERGAPRFGLEKSNVTALER